MFGGEVKGREKMGKDSWGRIAEHVGKDTILDAKWDKRFSDGIVNTPNTPNETG